MMVLLIALFALPARAAQNVPSDLYLAYYKNNVWNYSIFEKDASSKVFTCTHNFASGETFYVVKEPKAAAEPSKSNNMYEASDCNLTAGTERQVYLYGDSKNAYVNKSPAGLYTVKVDFSSVDEPYKLSFSSAIPDTKPNYTVWIVGNVGTDSWNDTLSSCPELSYVGNGIYRGEVNLKGSRHFRVNIGGSNEFGPNDDSNDKFVAEGTTETIYMNKALRAFQAPMLNKYFVSVDVYNNTVTIPTDVYLVGDVTGGWDTSHGWKFDTTDGVTYTLTGKNMSANTKFKLLTSKDVWYSNGKTDITVPHNSTLTTSGGDMQLSSDANNVNITFNLSTKAFSISGGSTPTPTYSYQLKGTIFDGSWQSKDMTKNDANGAWEWTGTVKKGEFGLNIMDGSDWKGWIWSADSSTISGTGVFSAIQESNGNGKNWSSELEGEFTFSFDPENMTLTISGGSTPTPSVSYRLKTSENNWSTFIPLTDNGDGTFGYTFTNPVEGLQFMVQRSTDNGQSYFDFCWPAADNKNYTGGNKTFTMSGAFGNDLTFGAGLSGEYTLTFTPNTTDSKQSTLTISGNSVAGFDDVYLRGSSPLSWTKSEDAYKFTTSDGKIYTLKDVNLGKDVKMKVLKKGTMYGYDNATVVGPAVSDDEQSMQLTDVVKLTENLVNATITVDFSGTKPVITIGNPKSAYLHGDFTDPNWTDKAEYKFSTTDNQTYVLEHVNIAKGKLMKVYYGGTYYGHDKDKVTGPVECENTTYYNIRLTEELKDATITFTISSTDASDWTITIVNGAKVEHKAYYFAGDMNRWYSKEFEGDASKKGIDSKIFEAEKDKWKFEYVGKVEGQPEKGWYKYVFDEKKVGMSTLVGQFQIIDRGDWNNGAEVYSHNPKVTDYNDASGFARYINNPITSEMIIDGTPLTKDGTPGIVKANGSNFHLDCNGVNHAVIYFLPGDNPKMIVKGDPTDYFVFYSANKKTDGDNTVSMQIVNDKPNVNNYFLPGVQNLKNYTKADASAEGPHMNIAPVVLTKINFLAENFEQTEPGFMNVFGASENVGDLTREQFVTMIKDQKKLPNGISLDGRGEVYVIKIPNGFEYAAGTKFAVKFDKAFAASEKGSTSTIVANHLYFFNDELHVMLNVDNYEKGAKDEKAFVELYYRVYGYDGAYNTVVVNSDGSTSVLYNKGDEIGLTAGSSTENLGWVAYNHYGVMPESFTGAPAGNWHYATPSAESTAIYGLDPKFGNFFVQFKIYTGPDVAPESANGPAKAVDKEYTLYLPEKTLALNQEGFYNFNGQDLYVALDGGYTTTDVEDVFEDQIVEEGVDAAPIFFNLQGQRVVNPEKGMYIVVKGNKTYKVMIK